VSETMRERLSGRIRMWLAFEYPSHRGAIGVRLEDFCLEVEALERANAGLRAWAECQEALARYDSLDGTSADMIAVLRRHGFTEPGPAGCREFVRDLRRKALALGREEPAT
jgi:hypothetical protein